MQSVEDLDPDLCPNLDELVTEEGKDGDSMFIERSRRLLTEPLFSSWRPPGGDPFLVMANIGQYYASNQPPVIPDILLVHRVTPAAGPLKPESRSYYQWMYDRRPDVAIEIVTDKLGGEEGHLMTTYARQRLLYYVIFDPGEILEHGVLRAFEVAGKRYQPIDPGHLAEVGLGLVLWDGVFQGFRGTWLRWCDEKGRIIPTGAERAEVAEERLELARALLRKAGLNPDDA